MMNSSGSMGGGIYRFPTDSHPQRVHLGGLGIHDYSLATRDVKAKELFEQVGPDTACEPP